MKLLYRLKKDYLGILFVLPVILGLAIFTFIPMVTSLFNSFQVWTDFYSGTTKFGFDNYIKIFSGGDSIFINSLLQTLLFTALDIPIRMTLSFLLALFLFKERTGVKFVRVLCYVPVIIPTVVSGVLWKNIMNTGNGYLNLILASIGIEKIAFFSNETALASFVFVGMFGIGSSMILWISQLKNIPKTVYEAADIEGANRAQALFKITLPLCGPTIFYVLITSIIGTLQVFDLAYMFYDSTNDSIYFLVVYIYHLAFGSIGADINMKYACALSWVLFAMIAFLSGLVFMCKKWVIYGEDYA